jgi:hypothetical protein
VGTLMANVADNVSAAAQTRILLVLVGQILAGAAGIRQGVTIFLRTRRKLLARLFAGLLGLRFFSVILGVYAFASNFPG